MIEELIKEAENNKKDWYHIPESRIMLSPYYAGNDYIMWLKKTVRYLKANFSNDEDAKRFIAIAEDKTSHCESELDEMLCCLKILVDEEEEPVLGSSGNDLIDLSIVDKAPFYIKDVLREANLCYKNTLYNGCAILLRKVTENLIIEAFEKNNRSAEIKDSNGDYFSLKHLIVALESASPSLWPISRNGKKSLEEIKKIGDLSAHNIKFSAKKGDIDKVIFDYREVLQEINLSIYGA